MGSSATAVVAGLVAANHLGRLELGAYELLLLAAEIEGHPDNTAPALMGGTGADCLRRKPKRRAGAHLCGAGPQLTAVLAVPAFELSTAKARSVLPEHVSHRDAVFNVGRVALFVAACTCRRWDLLRRAMEDRLHQPMRATLIPGLTEVLEAAKGAGGLGGSAFWCRAIGDSPYR